MNDSEDGCFSGNALPNSHRKACNPLTSYRCLILASEMIRLERRRQLAVDQGDPKADFKIQSISREQESAEIKALQKALQDEKESLLLPQIIRKLSAISTQDRDRRSFDE